MVLGLSCRDITKFIHIYPCEYIDFSGVKLYNYLGKSAEVVGFFVVKNQREK